jgi:1,2-diacylglycerol 3-alpha-glucosyltransferase
MRIAMMTDSYLPTRDGVVTAVMTLRKTLEELGHTVFIIAPDPGEEYREEGVIYFPATKFKKYPEYYIPIFPSDKRQIIESLDVDVIHIYGVAFMALKALIVSHTTRIPTVMTYVTNVVDAMEFYSPLKLPPYIQSKLAWIYLRNFLKRPSCIIALTPATIDEFKNNGVRTKRTEVIPIGIDIKHFSEGLDGSAIRKRYGLEGKRVVIHVGRVSYEKNIPQVIDAMAFMPDDVMLMVVGKGPALEEVKGHVVESGLSSRVIFTGFVSDEELPLHYASSDMVVSASRFETQGLTIVEAMACGIPAACASGRAFLDVIKEGYNGYLFDDSVEECSKAMIKCLENRENLLKGIHETALMYSTDKVGKDLADLYRSVIDERVIE